jgi:hypothetical protein
MSRYSVLVAMMSAFFAVSCGGDDKGPKARGAGEEPSVTLPEPVLRRLTEQQYLNSITDLLGGGLVLPTSLEPDESSDGLLSIGAGRSALSPLGVENYEDAAFDLAEQVMEPGEAREALVMCTPAGNADDSCAAETLEAFGTRAWRRPLTSEELNALVAIAGDAGTTLGDFYEGLELAMGYLLQSPHFLYRIELGDLDEQGVRRYSDYEMASRLSYFLWNTTPDDTLMAAAADGRLSSSDDIAAEVDRMLADDRARDGFRNLVDEMLELFDLEELIKDPTVFPAMRSEIGPSAREETLSTVEALVFDRDEDFRNWLTTRETYLDPNLAMLYAVPAPSLEGFAKATLPAKGARRGLLGQASILSLHAHPVSTSATRRGLFIRKTLLCQHIPPPPADVDTSIPEPSPDALTLRDRVATHLEEPFCANCHLAMDPMGLALENFDGIGLYRETENGATIDPSGDLDGVPFETPVELTEVLWENPNFTACMADTVYSYAAGHRPDLGEMDYASWLHRRFRDEGYSMKALLREVATSETFATAAEVAR